jgi:hypothetical protein
MTTFTPSPINFKIHTVSTRVYRTCTGAAKIISRPAAVACIAVASQWLRTFTTLATLRVAQCICALHYLYKNVVLGPLQEQETEPTYSVLYSYVVHVQSKKSNYDDSTPALTFHHPDILGSQVTVILVNHVHTLGP